jgi:very-short-patch-repair endonuclease
MDPKGARCDAIVARIAARQHGVVALEQLLRVGVSREAVKGRLRSGRLHRVHRGVYAVGHAKLTREGRWLAAVIACGQGAVLSHASAGALWGILSSTSPSFVDVTVWGYSGRKKRRGIKIHRSITLTSKDVTRRWGIPVTTRARTLRDLGLGQEPTRSELERAFVRLCRRHRLPKPEVNVRVGAYQVDFLWRDARLIVETDGYAFHSHRAAFEADRARDTDLKLRGYDVIRFTHHQVTRQPSTVAASLRALLQATAT